MPRKRKHPGSIDRHRKRYRVRLSVGGERHVFTLATDNRAAAEDFARRTQAELERQAKRRATGLPEPGHVSELFDRFERDIVPTLAPGTRRSYADSMKPIRAYFLVKREDPRVDHVRAADVNGFLVWRRANRLDGDKPVSNRTLQKDRAVLHRVFDLADRLELREGNPVSRVDPPKADPRTPVILSAEQYEKLLKACEGRPMLALYVLAMGETGARSESEVLFMRWEDVDLDGGFLWIDSGREGHRTKSGKGRWVPLTPRLAAALKSHAAAYRLAAYRGKRSPWVFHHVSEGRNRVRGERIGSMRHGFEAAVRRAKLPAALHQHDLRHRRVTTWLAEGANPVHVKEAMGHSDLRTTMGYTHLAREHLRSLVAPQSAKNDSEPNGDGERATRR